MLREKSNSKILTSWLKQHPSQSPSPRHNNENTMTEEEQLQRAIQQSREDYRAQQKHDYDLVSKSKPSTTTDDLPPIDDDDQWFQTISPRRIKREKKLSLKRTTPKRKRSNTNDTQTQSPTPTNITSTTKNSTKHQDQHQQRQQQQHSSEGSTVKTLAAKENDPCGSLGPIKEEDSWEICDDSQQSSNPQAQSPTTILRDSTAKKSTQKQQHQSSDGPVKEEEDSWEICDDPEPTQQENYDWEIEGSPSQAMVATKEEDDGWEINDDDMGQSDGNSIITSSSNNRPATRQSTNPNINNNTVTGDTHQGADDMEQYVSAIRNRTTKTVILPPSTSTSTPITGQQKRIATQLDDIFNVFKNRRSTPMMQKTRNMNTTTDHPSFNPPSVYQTSFDRHGTLTTNTVDNLDHDDSAPTHSNRKPSGHHSSTSVNGTTSSGGPGSTASEQQLQDSDAWDNDSDCSSIIDLCADGSNVKAMVLATSPDHGTNGPNNNSNISDLTSFFDDVDDADDELYNNHLDTAYDDSIQNNLDHDHWATTMDDNDLIFVDSNTTRPPSTTERRITAPPRNTVAESSWSTISTRSNSTHQAAEDDDDGYLSPLEGFTSLLEQSQTSAAYRPYFDQLTASAHPPTSSSRRPAIIRGRGGSSRSSTPRARGSSYRNRGGRRYKKRK